MLVATVLALAAALLHVAWNLVAKRSTDRFIALWGQFFVAALIGGAGVVVGGGVPAAGWGYAALTGVIHVPYVVALAGAYERGDFSVAYPIARGGGALLAGVGGLVLLDDDLTAWSMVAIVVVAAGMMLLAAGADVMQVAAALFVGVTIGAYTVNDSHASREFGGKVYPFAVFVTIGIGTTAYGIASRRSTKMIRALRASWWPFTCTAALAVASYGLVLLAVRRAPVGYVAALRESSVVIAAFLGARYLDERSARRRTLAAAVILGGLVLLIAAG